MSNQYIILRRSSVPGKIPNTSSLELGEIAINTYDGLIFMKKSGSQGEEIISFTNNNYSGSFTGSFLGNLEGTSSYALTASYTFSTGLTNTAGTITSNLSTGVSGGQSVVGGTSSGNNLTLSSTSHATKGKILFGTSAYDEVNNQLGIGTTTPSTALEIANGGTLKLGGGTAIGQGNILMNSNASIYYDSNVTYLGSNSQTMGMIASSTPAFLSSNGPSIFLRGNSYGAISGQRGLVGLIAGNPSSPTAGEGELRFYTGATLVRMVIGYNGNVGIGTTSPGYKLDIQGAAAETSLTNTTNNNRISFGFPSAAGGEPSLSAFTTGVTNGRIFQRQTSTKDVFIGDIDANGGGVHIRTNGNDSLNILSGGNVGIGQSSPTAVLHLKAGTATANTAPLKFTSGTNLTTPENGALEYDGTNLYFTVGGVRKTIQLI